MLTLDNVTVNMMVKNEQSYIRQSILSVVPYVKEFLIWDTGSTDKTLDIIKDLQKIWPNIKLFESHIEQDSIHWDGNHLSDALTEIRNAMIDETKTEWIMQVDGDEIYIRAAIENIAKGLKYIKDTRLDWVKGIMVKIKWCVSNTEYVSPGPFDRTLRLFKKEGKWIGSFPNEFYYVNNIPITISDNRCLVADTSFLHLSMALHPERRPINGHILNLSPEEQECLKQ